MVTEVSNIQQVCKGSSFKSLVLELDLFPDPIEKLSSGLGSLSELIDQMAEKNDSAFAPQHRLLINHKADNVAMILHPPFNIDFFKIDRLRCSPVF